MRILRQVLEQDLAAALARQVRPDSVQLFPGRDLQDRPSASVPGRQPPDLKPRDRAPREEEAGAGELQGQHVVEERLEGQVYDREVVRTLETVRE